MEQYAHNTRFILSCVTPDTKITLKDEIELEIKDIKGLGKVMAELMPKVKGRTDGSEISRIVKELLQS